MEAVGGRGSTRDSWQGGGRQNKTAGRRLKAEAQPGDVGRWGEAKQISWETWRGRGTSRGPGRCGEANKLGDTAGQRHEERGWEVWGGVQAPLLGRGHLPRQVDSVLLEHLSGISELQLALARPRNSLKLLPASTPTPPPTASIGGQVWRVQAEERPHLPRVH